MQKQIVAKFIFLGLAVFLVISIVFLLKGEKKDRTKNMYKKISNSSKYTFTIEEGISSGNKFIISKNEEDRSLDLTSNGEHTTTLVKEGYVYFITHKQKEYSVFENEDMEKIEADIIESDIDKIENTSYLTGKEKIYGKMYYYEEYEDIDSFIMSGIALDEETKLKTRFYFEGDNIKYIKNIIKDEEDIIEELLEINLTFDYDKTIFEIPSDYAEL